MSEDYLVKKFKVGLTLQVGGFVSMALQSQVGVAVSRDIANYGYDVNFWLRRLMLDLLNPGLMIYLLSQMHNVPKYIYT